MTSDRLKRQTSFPLVVLLVFIGLIFFGMSAASILRNRTTFISQAYTTSKAQAQLLGENTSSMIYAVDMLLLSIASMFEHHTAYGAVTASQSFGVVRPEIMMLPQMTNLTFLDADGIVEASLEPTADFKLAAFAEFRDAWLATTVETRFDRDKMATILLSRRVENYRGEFLGVLVATIDAAFLYDRYDDYLNIDADAVALYDNDGKVLSFWSDAADDGKPGAGRTISDLPGFQSPSDLHAAGGGRSTFEKKGSIVSTYQIRGFPYYVAVMYAKQNVLLPWYRETSRDIVIILVTTAIALLTIALAVRQHQHRKNAERLLLEHQLNLENTIRERTEELDRTNTSLMQKNEALEAALSEIKTLKGILPICSFCKNIRDDKGYWEKVEVYVRRHSQADFSHSVCPDCAKKHYPDLDLYEADTDANS